MVFDKRGVGLSDRVSEDRLPSLEVRMDDARAVMDAVGSERAVVLGVSEGGPMAMLFAATYPERTMALIAFGTSACWNDAPDYPYRSTEQELSEHEVWRLRREQLWGTKELARDFLAESFSPPLADDDSTQAWLANYMRNAASPGAVSALSAMNRAIDVRSALPAIHVPTLVLARDGDLDYAMEETKWFADQIHGARFVSFPGNEHLFVMGRQEDLIDEIERFVAEVRGEEADLDRMLATVMFTDIVGSTEKAAELGDKGWGISSSVTTAWCARCSAGSAARRSTPRATASSPRSTDRRAACGAPRRSVRLCGISASRSERGCTPARSRRSPGRPAASP